LLPNDLKTKLNNIPSSELEKAFVDQEKLTNTDKEIEENDKKDAYALRKFFKQVTQQFLVCLPLIAKFVLWTFAICIIAILSVGTFYIVRDEKKLFDVMWYAIWGSLIYMASHFRDNFLKKK
jgi:hypothetical protein